MMQQDAAVHLWPSDEQKLLLDSALQDGSRAVSAFHAWRQLVRLEDEFSRASMRLLPLVYGNLHRLGVQDPLMGRLKGVYRRAWYETHRLLHATAPLVEQLAQAGIPVLLTKGAPLALSYYRNPALRPMADVDVVVPAGRLHESLGVLARTGWRAPQVEAETLRFRHAIQCFGPDGTELDLHWRPMFEVTADRDVDTFLEQSEPLDFMGTPVRQPEPSHAFFLTVVHGVRWNLETPVRWIADALTILRARGHDIDWDLVTALGVRHRGSLRLGLGISCLARAFQAPVPQQVLARVEAARGSLFERLESKVLLGDDGSIHPSALRTQASYLAEYARHTTARNPVSFALGYTHYLRYRLGLGGRRELLPRILHGLRRRLVTNGHGPPNEASRRP